MVIVRSEFNEELFVALKAVYDSEYQTVTAASFYREVCSIVPSSTRTERYQYLGAWPYMREWLDERQVEGLRGKAFTIENKKYEATVGLDIDDVEDNALGDIRLQVQNMAANAATHPDELVTTLMEAGASTLCFDGQYFHDTDHAWGDSGTQSNKLTGTGVDTTAKIEADLQAAIAAMRVFKNDRGKIMNLVPTHVVIPPAIEWNFRKVLEAALISTGGTNVMANLNLKLIINPLLTDVNDWYLKCCSKPMKPYIFQTRKAPRFTTPDAGMSDRKFMKGEELYGVDGRYGNGYGHWAMSVLTTNS